jgi:hypothetical protein
MGFSLGSSETMRDNAKSAKRNPIAVCTTTIARVGPVGTMSPYPIVNCVMALKYRASQTDEAPFN